MLKIDQMAAAVLAGGRNSRMAGANKAFLRINGVEIIKRTLLTLERLFGEIIIVTNSPGDFKAYEKIAIIVPDLIKSAGPLSGIHSALSITSKKAVFFVACDMPFLHNGVIICQAEYFNRSRCDCCVPRIGSKIEPLHAIYKSAIKDSLRKTLAAGGDNSIRGFLRSVNACYWDLPDKPLYRKIFSNINTKDDLLDAQRLLKS